MNRNASGALALVVLFSLFAPAFRGGQSGGAATSGSPASAAIGAQGAGKVEQAKECPTEGYPAELLRLLQRSLSTGPAAGTGQTGQDCPADFQIPGIDQKTIHPIIALAPDPLHTNLALFFDRQMEAVEQAAQDCGWIFEEALMPWDSKSHPESSDFKIRDGLKEQVAQREAHPGLLIFRRTFEAQQVEQDPCGVIQGHSSSSSQQSAGAGANDEQGQSGKAPNPSEQAPAQDAGAEKMVLHKLLVFVVAETPTGGIRKTQFRNAIAMINQLFRNTPPDVLRIMGPTFSGSLQSLAELLDCPKSVVDFPCGQARHVSIHSGTVTGRDSVAAFKAMVPADGRVRFRTLQEFDENAEELFLKFVCQRNYEARRVAVLSEDETAYGNKPSKTREDKATGYQDAGTCDADDMLLLYFPREISRLRTAYQKIQESDASRQKTPRSTLPLDLNSPGGDGDTVPQYSERQVPLSQEAVLLGLVAELRRHSIELVLLRATNPLDQLFLARYLRQAYPQGRIIIGGADLLFAREVQDAQLHGVMALTTYTLSPGTDHIFEEDEQHHNRKHSDRVFSGSDAVGTYNAMTLLLEDHPPMPGEKEAADKTRNEIIQENRCPANSIVAHLAQYDWPKLSDPASPEMLFRPPVHLSVLGHGGFWDLAILDPSLLPKPQEQTLNATALPLICDPFAETAPERSPQLGARHILHQLMPRQRYLHIVPMSWKLFGLLALGLSLSYVLSLWSASVLSRSEAVAHLAPPIKDSRAWLFAATGYLHFFMLAILVWASPLYAKNGFKEGLFVSCLVAIVILIFIICSIDLEQRQAPMHARRFRTAVVLTVLGILALWWSGYFDYMFMWRSLNLTSGISPLLPILLLLGTGLWGTWYSISGSVFVDQRRPALPRADATLPRFRRFRPILEGTQGNLLNLLRPNYLEPRIAAIAGVVMLGTWGIANLNPLRSLEQPWYEYVLAVLAGAAVALLVAATCRLCALWRELRGLLQALDALPLRRGFKKLQGFSWSLSWRVGAGSLGDFRRLVNREYEGREGIRKLGVDLAQTPGQPAGPIDTQRERVRNEYEKSDDNWLSDVLDHLPGTKPSAGGPQQPAGAAPQVQEVGKIEKLLSWFAAKFDRLHNWLALRFGKLRNWRASIFRKLLVWLESILVQIPIIRFIPAWVRKANQQRALDRDLVNAFVDAQDQLAKDGAGALSFLNSAWQEPAPNETEQSKIAAVEEFLAAIYTSFILIVIVRMRTLVVAIGGMYVLIMLALSVYPFQPQVGIRLSLIALLAFIVAAVGMVYAQMHRDATLSYITDTTPGQLGGDFWIRIATFVAVPVLGLIVSQYPEIGGAVNSWVEPALGALGK